MSVIQMKPMRCIETHSLDEISWGMSASQIGLRRYTTTHLLDGILWRYVSNSNKAQGVHRNSQTGWDFIGSMSAVHIKPRRYTTTHSLDMILWKHVSQSIGA